MKEDEQTAGRTLPFTAQQQLYLTKEAQDSVGRFAVSHLLKEVQTMVMQDAAACRVNALAGVGKGCSLLPPRGQYWNVKACAFLAMHFYFVSFFY